MHLSREGDEFVEMDVVVFRVENALGRAARMSGDPVAIEIEGEVVARPVAVAWC